MRVAAAAAAAAAAIGLGLTVALAPWLFALILPAGVALGVLALVLVWVATGDAHDRGVARWTYASYLLHLGLSLTIGTSNLTVMFFGPDANTYHVVSVKVARHWSEGTPMPDLPLGKEGFFFALARLYDLLGPYRVSGLALTSLCSALLVPLVADSTRRLFGRRAAAAVLPLLVLLPGILVWTSQLLREAPILACLALGGNLAIRLSERLSAGRFLALGLTLAVLFTLRANIAYVFAGAMLVGLVLSGRHLMAGVATAAISLTLVAAIVVGGGLGESGYEYVAAADLEQVNTLRSNLANTANTGIARDADISTPSGSLAYLPIGVPQLLLGPFPWQVRNLKQFLGLLEAMTLWPLVPALVRGLRQARRSSGRRVALLLAPAAGITLVLALIIGNYGTIVRERLQVLIFLLPLVALGRVPADDEDPAPPTERGATAPVVAALSAGSQ